LKAIGKVVNLIDDFLIGLDLCLAFYDLLVNLAADPAPHTLELQVHILLDDFSFVNVLGLQFLKL
jgi:hypothetical protein